MSAVRVLRRSGDVEPWLEQLRDLAANPQAFPSTEVLKRDPYSTAGLLECAGELYFGKHYRAKSPLQRWHFRIGGGRAVAAFDAAQQLLAAELAVAVPIACFGVPGAQLLVTQALSGARDLRSIWQLAADGDDMSQLLAAAGSTLAGWHSKGFAHGDCKWSNWMWCEQRGFYLVDLEAVQRNKSAAQHRDLARFVLNAEDFGVPAAVFEPFLHRYCQGMNCDERQVYADVLPLLRRLRRRHRAKYGERGARLFPD